MKARKKTRTYWRLYDLDNRSVYVFDSYWPAYRLLRMLKPCGYRVRRPGVVAVWDRLDEAYMDTETYANCSLVLRRRKKKRLARKKAACSKGTA